MSLVNMWTSLMRSTSFVLNCILLKCMYCNLGISGQNLFLDKQWAALNLTFTVQPVKIRSPATKGEKHTKDHVQWVLYRSIVGSKVGLGYSKRMPRFTSAEQGYAQIERELFAIVFGCSRFDQYVYRREAIVQTDHKPLETILQRCLVDTPKRLQRMLLVLQWYDLSVSYTAGKHMHVADALSRVPIDDNMACRDQEHAQQHEGLTTQVLQIREAIADPTLDSIKNSMATDPTMKSLHQMIQEGWPLINIKYPHTYGRSFTTGTN